ncbi:MAG: LytR/AlgR family response regulator transcription factor [Woeseiaceae bacterium]
MNILIVDDEAPARGRLRQLIEDGGEHRVVGEAANGREALELAAKLTPDVVLLDIRMPELDGIETAQHFNSFDNPPAIVFATAYDEYAMQAFEANAVGYVLKPVRRERLDTALRRAARFGTDRLREIAGQAGLQSPRRHICSKQHGELRLIAVDEILCFLADQKYVNVVHTRGADLIDESLKSLEEEFAGAFVRVHRAALAAVRHIDSLGRNSHGQLELKLRGANPRSVPKLVVSRRHVADLRRRLQGD